MAGGIDWFRWHHGSVTDPKFQLVARRAGASLPDVLAVWAFVLETASANCDRGQIGEIDSEALDCLFNFPNTETRTADILAAFETRGLIANGAVAAWEKRQPKREDETANDRKRRQREREHEGAMSRNVTQSHVGVTQGHAREEKRREEEEIQEPSVLVAEAAPSTTYRVPKCPTEELVALYHRHLPALPVVEVMNDGRKRSLSARWRDVCGDGKFDKSAGLEWFSWFFERVAGSDFLMGRTAGKSGQHWRADFDFLTTPTKFAKVVEGRYHQGA